VFYVVDWTGARDVVALNADGSRNSPQSPAQPGSEVALYATGLGQTQPASVDGVKRAADRILAGSLKVQVNGVNATLVYAGPAPGFVGLEQINILVPATTSGAVSLEAAGVSRLQSGTLWIAQ
jgi:uncharacterized protein (TIGR03437 family)